MKKGNVNLALAGALIVTAVIALSITDSICAPFCQCIDATAINKTLLVNEWVNDTCEGTKCESGYSVTCNSTELEVGDEYNIDNCNVELTNETWNNTNCQLDYTYEGDYYHGNDVVGLIMCNIPLIAALSTLALAGAWIFMKGGF